MKAEDTLKKIATALGIGNCPEARLRRLESKKDFLLREIKKASWNGKVGTIRAINASAYYKLERGLEFTQKQKDILGADCKTVRAHIESQFTEGMSWSNWGEWHYEHYIPYASCESIEEIVKVSHYTNVSPVWATENLSKGAKYCKLEKEQFIKSIKL